MNGEDVNVREARIVETHHGLMALTADEHHEAGCRRMAYAIESPDAPDALKEAVLATAHFTVAQAIYAKWAAGEQAEGYVGGEMW